MIPVDDTNDLGRHRNRRESYLSDRPVKGDVMYRNGRPVTGIDVNDFSFEVKVRPADVGAEWVPFDELTPQR
jgi:hypothetical protein